MNPDHDTVSGNIRSATDVSAGELRAWLGALRASQSTASATLEAFQLDPGS